MLRNGCLRCARHEALILCVWRSSRTSGSGALDIGAGRPAVAALHFFAVTTSTARRAVWLSAWRSDAVRMCVERVRRLGWAQGGWRLVQHEDGHISSNIRCGRMGRTGQTGRG